MTKTDLAAKLEDVNAAQAAGQAVEPRTETTKDLVVRMQPQFARALPAHVDAERFTRLCLTALRTVPRLAECSGQSVLAGMMQAASLGVEIDAVRQQAFLVPRYNKGTRSMEATFQLGYRGLIDLAGRGGIIIDAQTVHANDNFRFAKGLTERLEHTWSLSTDRGEPIGYYAVARFADDRAPAFDVLTVSEATTVRDRFGAKAKDNTPTGPWVEHFDAMARKSVIRKLLNYLPLPVELADAFASDDIPVDVTPAPIAVVSEPVDEELAVLPGQQELAAEEPPPVDVETTTDVGDWEDPDSPEVVERTATTPKAKKAAS